MKIKLLLSRNIKMQYYFLIIFFIGIAIFIPTQIKNKADIVNLFNLCLFEFWIIFFIFFILNLCLKKFEITEIGIYIYNIYGNKKFIPYHDCFIEYSSSSVNLNSLLITQNKKKYLINSKNTNFQEAIDFLRKNGKLS